MHQTCLSHDSSRKGFNVPWFGFSLAKKKYIKPIYLGRGRGTEGYKMMGENKEGSFAELKWGSH